MPFSAGVSQAALLYFSDATLVVLFAVGVASLVRVYLARELRQWFVEVTPRQAAGLVVFQIGVVLLALVGFKYVVLSGGPGVAVHRILATGVFTRVFSRVAVALALVLVGVGAVRVVSVVRQVVRRVQR